MGGSSSKTRTKVQNTLVNQSINKCPLVAVDSSIRLTDFKFRCADNCKEDCVVDMTQQSAVDASCVIDNAQTALADIFAASAASAEAGIGIAAGDSKTTIKTKIANYVENKCGDVGVRKEFEGVGMDVYACQYKGVQSTDIASKCKLGVLQGIESHSNAQSESTAKGLNPTSLVFGFLLAFWMPILIGIVVLIVGVWAIKSFFGSSGRSSRFPMISQMPQMPQIPRIPVSQTVVPRMRFGRNRW